MSNATVTEFRPATRIQESALASLEKKTLRWLAARTPRAINSDHLTCLGFGAMLAAGAAYAVSALNPQWLWTASALIVVNWYGDSLDGTLARSRKQQRPRYGFYVDHVVDAIGTLALFTGLALSGLMSPWIAVGLLVSYYLLFIEVSLATYALGRFQISVAAFGPTELRLLLIAGNIRAFFAPTASIGGHDFLLFDIGGLCGIIGMTAVFVFQAISHTLQLYREEPISQLASTTLEPKAEECR